MKDKTRPWGGEITPSQGRQLELRLASSCQNTSVGSSQIPTDQANEDPITREEEFGQFYPSQWSKKGPLNSYRKTLCYLNYTVPLQQIIAQRRRISQERAAIAFDTMRACIAAIPLDFKARSREAYPHLRQDLAAVLYLRTQYNLSAADIALYFGATGFRIERYYQTARLLNLLHLQVTGRKL